jgi:hypothetical protein
LHNLNANAPQAKNSREHSHLANEPVNGLGPLGE